MTTYQPQPSAPQFPPLWAAKLSQSARAAIPVGHQRLLRCCMAMVGWVLGVGWSTAPAMAAVTITELYPAPVSGELEWVELYNDSSTDSVNLTGWWLQDQVSSPSLITTISDLVLPPLSYTTISWTSSKLNNSGDTVTLLDADNQAKESVTFISIGTGQSWAKFMSGGESSWLQGTPSPGQANPLPSPLPQPTPSPTPTPSPSSSATPTPLPTTFPSPSPSPSASPSPSPVVNPTDLQITAVMACPTDSQTEWIKLQNQSSSQLNLTNWYVTDAADNRRNLTGTLNSQTEATIEFSSSFINNTGETIWLYTPMNQVAQTITLPSCVEKGVAFIKSGSNWVSQNQNIQTSPSPTPTPVLSTITPVETYPDYLPGGFQPYSNQTSKTSINEPLRAQTAGVSAQLNQLLLQNPTHLDLPQTITNLFQEPVELFSLATITTTNGAWELIAGGSLISLSSIYQVIQKIIR
jgi:hypothetical protein